MNHEDLFSQGFLRGFAVEMLPALQVCELFDRLQGLSVSGNDTKVVGCPSPVIGWNNSSMYRILTYI